MSTTETPRTDTSTTKTFADFGVEQSLCDSLAAVGITAPFPIQELTLPLALSGADIIGQARTGTGKTLGFGLPMLQRVDLDAGLQVLVIVPTRELCLQVAEDLAQAGRGRGVDVVAVYGGKAIQPQIDAIAAGTHVVVGTPGRLLDLSRRGVMDLSGCHGLVLDEADEMLDLGFLPDVEALIEMCASERQTLLFSATMPSAIVGLARRYMTKPTFMRADVEEINVAPETQQYFFSCHRMDKPAVLARILQTPDRGLCVVFCRTKRMADTLAEELRDREVSAQAIHSDLRQEARERALQKFREGKITVLCATEVAARGLDIDDVTHVVNYDCPDDEKMYLHRIGRTGRAGAEGVAITLAVWNELPRLEMIRRDLDIDEEVHEVFSTSPLLDELFDLPKREERDKVPSPPQARSGKGSRSKRRAVKDDDGDRARSKGSRTSRPRAEDRSGEDAPATKPSDDGGYADGGPTRTRTRRRRKTVEGRDEAPAASASAADRDDDGDDGRSRSRTRTRRGGSGRTSGDDRSGSTTSRSEAERTKAEQPKGERTKGERTKAEQPKGERAKGERAKGERAKGERGKGEASEGSRGRRGGRSGQSRSKDRGEQDSTNGRSRGDRSKDRDRGGRSGRRGRGGDGDGGGRRSTVDVDEARGDGQPRLTRKLEVVHLP